MKKKRQAIKYDTVDGPGYINKFTSFALNASNDWILFENDRRCSFFNAHAFSQECEESLLNGTSDLWILRCFTDTETSAIRHAVDHWRKKQFRAFHSIFGTKKLLRKTWRTFLRNLFWHGCCKIVISTTVTYVTLRTHALVDTCDMSKWPSRDNFHHNFDWRLGTANRLVTRDTWLFTRCGKYRICPDAVPGVDKKTTCDGAPPWSSPQKSCKCPKQQTPWCSTQTPWLLTEVKGSWSTQKWAMGNFKCSKSTALMWFWCTPFCDLRFGHP